MQATVGTPCSFVATDVEDLGQAEVASGRATAEAGTGQWVI